MFIAIVNAKGFKSYLGPYASKAEAREAQRKCVEMALSMGCKREDITSEVVELEKL